MDKLAPFRLRLEAQELLRDREAMEKNLLQSKTLRSVAGYSDATMKAFYRAARSLFDQERFVDAADAFLFLATIDPIQYEFWQGLGMAEQAQARYEEALYAYSMANLAKFEDPHCHFYAGKCHYALGHIHEAIVSLNLALAFTAEQAKYDKVKRLTEEALSFLKKAHHKEFAEAQRAR